MTVEAAETAAVIHKNKTKVSTHFSLDAEVNERSGAETTTPLFLALFELEGGNFPSL